VHLPDVLDLARALMATHGVEDWELGLDRARRRAGQTDHARHRITLSRHLMGLYDEAEVRDEPLPGARDRTWRAIQSCLQRFDTADAAALEGFDPGAIPDAPLLHVANNTLIIDEDTRIEQSYVDAVRRWYGSEVGRIGSDGAKAALDAWTALHTGGLIRRSAIRITPDTRLVLQNAILFAARWAKPFKAENTSKGASFTRADGGRTRADMMHITGSYTLVKGEGWRALRLPYATGAPDGAGTGIGTGIGDRRGTAGLAMDIILPDAVASPADLPPSTWGAATRALNRAERLPRGDFDVIVGLPRLDLNPGAVDLIPLLEELGIGIWGLELSHIAPRLILEQAFQQTRLLVDEAGTVAASLTEAAFMRGAVHAAPRRTKRFICDRPFVLRVVDLDSGAAVFEAAVLDPEAFVLAGGVSEAGELLAAPTRTSLEESLTARTFRPMPSVMVATLGSNAGIAGAADLAGTD